MWILIIFANDLTSWNVLYSLFSPLCAPPPCQLLQKEGIQESGYPATAVANMSVVGGGDHELRRSWNIGTQGLNRSFYYV